VLSSEVLINNLNLINENILVRWYVSFKDNRRLYFKLSSLRKYDKRFRNRLKLFQNLFIGQAAWVCALKHFTLLLMFQ
jgi:hypothetical protein